MVPAEQRPIATTTVPGIQRVQPVRLREDSRRKSKSCRGQTGLRRSQPGEAGLPHREYWPRWLNERPTGPILSVAYIPKGSDRSQPREPLSTYPPGPRLSMRFGPTPQPTPPASGPHHRHLPARPRRQFLPRLRDGSAGPAPFPGAVARPTVPAGSPPPPGPDALAARRPLPAGRRLRPQDPGDVLRARRLRPRLPDPQTRPRPRCASLGRRTGPDARLLQPPGHRLVRPPGHAPELPPGFPDGWHVPGLGAGGGHRRGVGP